MTEPSNNIIVTCPHCKGYVEIIQINCAIFRHAIFILSGKQIDPHTTKDLCEQYIKDNLIYGCGKPFRIVIKDNILITEICDYI